MDLYYGSSNYIRTRGSLPQFPLVNMFTEQSPIETSPVLLSRPGLTSAGFSAGSSAQTMSWPLGVLDGIGPYSISGSNLYKKNTYLGTLDGGGNAKIDAYTTAVFATQGQSLYKYDGSSFTTVATPGGFAVGDLCVGASRLIVIQANTGKLWWSDALTSTIGALSFATAENSPDNLIGCMYKGDTLILFGTDSVEFWPATTDATAPFAPLTGRTYSVGMWTAGAYTPVKDTFAWITSKGQVCLGDPESVISTQDIEERIAQGGILANSMWTFEIEGTHFVALRLPSGTFVYNLRSQTWSEFRSYGRSNWLPTCYARNIFGTSIGVGMKWALNSYKDDGDPANTSYLMERYFRAGYPLNSGTIPISNLQLRTNPGQASLSDSSNPVVAVRTSRDGGQTWGSWLNRSLGNTGAYRNCIQWRSLGAFSYPGFLAEFRVQEPIPFRVSGVTANEPYGNI